MNLDTVLTALAGVLDDAPNINVTPRPPTSLEPPQAFISNVQVLPHDMFEGGFDVTVEVSYLLSLGDLDGTWTLANDLMSSATTNSIYTVLGAKPTLSGAVMSVRLERLTGPDWQEYAGVNYWGLSAIVNIYAT